MEERDSFEPEAERDSDTAEAGSTGEFGERMTQDVLSEEVLSLEDQRWRFRDFHSQAMALAEGFLLSQMALKEREEQPVRHLPPEEDMDAPESQKSPPESGERLETERVTQEDDSRSTSTGKLGGSVCAFYQGGVGPSIWNQQHREIMEGSDGAMTSLGSSYQVREVALASTVEKPHSESLNTSEVITMSDSFPNSPAAQSSCDSLGGDEPDSSNCLESGTQGLEPTSSTTEEPNSNSLEAVPLEWFGAIRNISSSSPVMACKSQKEVSYKSQLREAS
ncbi:hypothetical protein JD844_013894 [Phrynosoma platyrhinos]|uniref:Uncharacterized protein n=1 Tax=Phrynosoma platyrhinos TaxID=52577 RepID=A0ABQ7TLV3_PHRPL|nr:hypothetical protein JD844_013894 [Phrynosoma platyrhinos]